MITAQTLFKKKLLIVLFTIIIAITVVEIWAVNRLATFGLQINQLESTISSLKLENQIMENKIAKQASLKELQTKIKVLGFEKIKAVQYLKVPDLALNK